MKHLRSLILITAALALAACSESKEGDQKPTLLSKILITANENKGVDEVLDFYDGICTYSVGEIFSSETSTKKYFELELSKSEAIEERADALEIPASNIAYLFFRNLNKEERDNYDEIHVVLTLKNEEKMDFYFKSNQLELVDQRMNVVNKVVGLLKEKNFEDLERMLNNTTIKEYDKNTLMANVEKLESQLGNITEGFRPFGYSINTSKNGNEVLHVSGAIIRDKQSNAFSVDLDLNGKDETIYEIQYKK